MTKLECNMCRDRESENQYISGHKKLLQSKNKITLINIILVYTCKLYKRDPGSSCQGKNETKYIKQHCVFSCLMFILVLLPFECHFESQESLAHTLQFLGFSSFLPFHFFNFKHKFFEVNQICYRISQLTFFLFVFFIVYSFSLILQSFIAFLMFLLVLRFLS